MFQRIVNLFSRVIQTISEQHVGTKGSYRLVLELPFQFYFDGIPELAQLVGEAMGQNEAIPFLKEATQADISHPFLQGCHAVTMKEAAPTRGHPVRPRRKDRNSALTCVSIVLPYPAARDEKLHKY